MPDRAQEEERGLDTDAIRQACFDPGMFVKRETTPNEYGGTDLEPASRLAGARSRGRYRGWG
jgi:hypothetical protein